MVSILRKTMNGVKKLDIIKHKLLVILLVMVRR